jgi:hypothetical protein
MPSASDDALPSKLTVSGAVPDVGLADPRATGAWFTGAPDLGTTNKVMLCAGTLRVNDEPAV